MISTTFGRKRSVAISRKEAHGTGCAKNSYHTWEDEGQDSSEKKIDRNR